MKDFYMIRHSVSDNILHLTCFHYFFVPKLGRSTIKKMGKVMKFIFNDNSDIQQQFVGKTGIKDLQRNARLNLNCHIMSATILKAYLSLLY